MTSEWKETTLEDCTSLLGDGLHGTPQYTQNGEYAFVNGNNLVNGRIIIKSDTKRVNRTQFEKYKKELCDRTIMVSINGTLGNVALYNGEKIILGKSACYFNVLESVDKDFIRYVVSSPSFRTYLETNATGTTIKNISLKQMRDYSFYIPGYETQKRISGILRSIDDRISLNTAINENLEQQAQALSDKWVAEHLDCITMRPLAEVVEINPDTYSPKDKWTFVNYLDTSSITNGVMSEIQLIRPDTEKLPSRARRIIKANDIVYSTVRPNQFHFGIISNPLDNMLASTGFAVIRSKYDYISSPYIYHFLTSPDFIEKMQQLAEQSTSTFPSVKPSDIGTCLIPCADEAEMLDITDKINGMYALVSANHQENKRLAALRDTLLPKLMNGEIDVSAVKI